MAVPGGAGRLVRSAVAGFRRMGDAADGRAAERRGGRGRQSARLEAVRFDGGVALSQDGNTLAIRTGQAIYVARRDATGTRALEVGGTRNIGTFFLAAGLQIVAAQDPAHPALQPGGWQIDCTGRRPSRALVCCPGCGHAGFNHALVACRTGRAIGHRARNASEHVSRTAIEAVAHEDAVYHEARRVLSPRRYRQAMTQGQTTAIPTLDASVSKVSVTAQKGAIQSPTTQAGDPGPPK